MRQQSIKEHSTPQEYRQDLIDRINDTARLEVSRSPAKRHLFSPRGRHAKPSRIVSPTRSIIALTLAVSSLCVTPAITANATEHTIRDRASSVIEPSQSTSTSDVDVSLESKTQTTVDPELPPTQSDGSDMDNGLSPQSGSSEPADAASPKAELPASGTWGTCKWTIDSDGVLTIGEGTGVDIVGDNGAPWFSYAGQVTSIRTTGTVVLPRNSQRLFNGMINLTDISGLANFDTSNVTIAHSMFYNCHKLTDLNPLSRWNTTNIANLGYMFTGCNEITTIESLAAWRLPKAYHLQGMFQDCYKLTNIQATANWDLGDALTQTGWMFRDCHELADISPLASWKVTNITHTAGMFQSCPKITTTAPLKDWGTSKLTNMSYMFYGFEKNGVKSTLTDLSGLAAWDVSKVVSMTYLFADQPQLQDLSPLTGWNTSSVIDMNSLFMNDASINNLSALSGWETGNVAAMDRVFQGCGSVSSLEPLASWDTSKVKTMMYMFYHCNLTSLKPLSQWQTGSVTKMMGMFQGNTRLTSLDGLESWTTSSLIHLGDPNVSPAGAFSGCTSLTDISGLANWDVSKVQNMRDVFFGDKALTDITPLSRWKTTSLARIDGMFLSTGIQNVDALENWNTSKVWTTWGTFYKCPNLTNIDGISGWNTTSLKQMSIMFVEAPITNLNALKNWDVSHVTHAAQMFQGCSKLTDASALADWDLNSIDPQNSTQVFDGCSSLELAGVPTVDHNGAWLLSEYVKATGSKGWTAYDWAPVNRNLTGAQVQAGYTGSNSTITDVRVWRLGVKYWGTCPWWLDDDGTLHINDVPGEGVGADNTSEQQVPWYSVRSKVKQIVTQDAVHMPNRSLYLFCQMPNLTDVSGLSRWDSSKTSDLAYLFYRSKALTSLAPITSWNVSSVTRMSGSFSWMDSLQSLEPLKNWNVSSLIIANHLFQGCQSVTDLEPLGNWDVSNVTNMRCLFEGCTGLKNLHGLENWDVRKVTDMGAFLSMYAWGGDGPIAYSRPTQLTDISALENWETSSLDVASAFLAGCSKLTEIDALKNLDISKVDDLGNMFYKCTSLEDTSAIANWDASKVVKTGGMFAGDGALTRIGVPAINKGAEVVLKAYPNRNWTDEGLPITPLKDSNGIYPYMTSNDEDREFTDNGGVFIPYQPVYIVTFNNNGATRPGSLPDRQWAYVNPTGSQSGSVNLPVDYKGSRTGYHFAGWSTTPDASSGVISPDDATWRPSGGLSTGDPSKIVLYAVWEANLTSELPSTGSRGLLELVFGFLSMIGLLVATGRTRKPRHGA